MEGKVASVGAWVSEPIKEDLEREREGGRGRQCMVDSCTHLGQEDRQKVEGKRTWEENTLEPCLGQVTLHFDRVSERLSATSPSHLFYIKKKSQARTRASPTRSGRKGRGRREGCHKVNSSRRRRKASSEDYIEARGGVGEQGATGDRQWSPGSEARGWESRRGREDV